MSTETGGKTEKATQPTKKFMKKPIKTAHPSQSEYKLGINGSSVLLILVETGH